MIEIDIVFCEWYLSLPQAQHGYQKGEWEFPSSKVSVSPAMLVQQRPYVTASCPSVCEREREVLRSWEWQMS